MTQGANDTLQAAAQLLRQAAETHHSVFAMRPVRSKLTSLLVELDREYTYDKPDQPWETFYAQRLVAHFTTSK